MVPKGWTKICLRDVAEIKRGAGSQYIEYVDTAESGVRLVRISDFLGDSPKYVKFNRDINRFLLERGDILIAGTGATAGIVFEVPDHFSGLAFSYNAPRIRIDNDQANNKYIFYYLQSGHVLRQQKQRFTGNAQPFLDTNDIGDFSILLPPKDEQEKISTLIRTWDKAIETVDKLIENSQKQKKWLMQNLLTGKKRLPGFNGEWKKGRLSTLCTIEKGTQKNKDTLDQSGNHPVINGGIQPSGYCDEYNTEPHTITISEGGNSCGYVGLVNVPFWCGGHCYALHNLKIGHMFLYQALKSVEPEIMKLRVGSGLPNIQKKTCQM